MYSTRPTTQMAPQPAAYAGKVSQQTSSIAMTAGRFSTVFWWPRWTQLKW
jgi:hypothetical protein